MNKARIWTLLIALGIAACGAAQAQTIGYNIRTGDVWVDTRLGEINDYGRRYREPFFDEMSGYYGAPRPLLVELIDQRHWAPADVYYACAMARALNLPCAEVVREYDRHPGQGWGAVAKRYGIKPGSPAFHAFKRGAATTYGHWGYPVVVDRPVRVDWSQHGPGKGKGPSHASQAKGSSPSRSHSPSGKDHGGNGKGHGGDKGDKGGHGKGNNGKGNGKGH
ncbi:hypothetical protein FCE95_15515 [Luteimonas gilva]|uniref:Uncharacterized protein n=1 Tax=Luteimonas gilva TaxID=2572684 RepID=A0A4U5JIZ9_9GAMM|nr:hypothetical protein [Luteimonas gilva]TKR29540.1 hypothetical protein FCE95_15515 [Luteimonas gilva]